MALRTNIARPYNRSFDGVSHLHIDEDQRRAHGARQIARYAREAATRGGALTAIRQGGSSPDMAKIEAASIGFATSLNNRLQRPGPLHSRFARMLRTNKLLNRELWLDNIPKMRLWEGDKVLSMLRAESLSIVTRPHEASIMVPKSAILNDQLGLYQPKIDSLGDSYLWHLDEMFVAMLIAGLQGTALGTTYDGQNLIDTDHTFLGNGQGVQYSNKVTGAFTATVFQSAVNAFMLMKDENGLPVGIGDRQLYLLHGPLNRNAVRTVLQQENIVGQTQTNLDKGTAIPVCSQWITAGAVYNFAGTNITLTGLEWFLIPDGSTAIMIQIKEDPLFLAVDKGDDEFTFRTGKYLYGLESEDGAAYGMPQEIVGGPGS
jgi:phage major head subunit gpT-like protein